MNILCLAASVPDVSFDGWRHVRVRALLVGKRIDLRALQRSGLTGQLVAVPAGERGLAVLFRYRAVVSFHMQPIEQVAFLKSLQSVVGEPFETAESEEADIVVDDSAQTEDVGADRRLHDKGRRVDDGVQTEGVDGTGNIRLQRVTMDRLLVIADVWRKASSSPTTRTGWPRSSTASSRWRPGCTGPGGRSRSRIFSAISLTC